VLLADIALNFLRSLISKQWQEAGSWAGSAWAAALAERAAAGIASLARLHDSYLLCKDPVVALKVAGGLWGLAILGQYLRWVLVGGDGCWWVWGGWVRMCADECRGRRMAHGGCWGGAWRALVQ
jgi:hypothetical protein